MKVYLHEVIVEICMRLELARSGTDRTNDLASLCVVAPLPQQAMVMNSLLGIMLFEQVVLQSLQAGMSVPVKMHFE